MSGKREKPALPMRKRSALVVLSLVLILAMSVGGTLAYLYTQTDSVTNTFTPGNISTDIIEDLKGDTKKSATVMNTGGVDVYVRARVIVNWVDEKGNIVPAPADAPEVKMNTSDDGWKKGADGYYYWQKPLAPKGTTASLIESTKLVEKDGKRMQVTILSQAVQAAGGAVEEAWKGCGLTSTDANK